MVNADLSAVSVTARLSEFWTDQPRNWFIQIESILNPKHLSDQARYDLVIGKLSKDAIGQVTDLLLQPPTTGKFNALKEKLLYVYEDSATRQLQKLLSEMELEEQKPSQLLRRMRDLARGKIPDETLTILWQNHLPAAIRAVLAVSGGKNLDQLAATVDTVLEATRPLQISKVVTSPTVGWDKNTAVVLAEIAKLTSRLENLEGSSSNQGHQCRCNHRGRGRSRQRSLSRQRFSSRGRSVPRRSREDPDWLCTYHFRYKENARRCGSPCAWKKQQGN